MKNPKSKSATPAAPRLGTVVEIRSRYFAKPTCGLIVGTHGDNTNDVVVTAFPVGRDPIQIPDIPFFESEPPPDVRFAVWPA